MRLDICTYSFYKQEKNTPMKDHVFLILLCFFIVGCTTPGLQPLQGDSAFEGNELTLIERAEKEQAILEESGFIYEDQELEAYLNDVVKRLYPPTLQSQTPPRVKVIKDPNLDAFVFPTGMIYIHTGILSRLDNEAQLAALLAHEMIHHINRHPFKAFGGYERHQVVQGSQSRLKDLLNQLGATLSMAAMAGYSQALETEADLEGLALVTAAGYDPREAIRLFRHLKQEVKTERFKEPLFFGIHPRIDKRVDNCENFLLSHPETGKKGFLKHGVFLEKTHEVVLVNAFLDLKAGRYESARRGAEKYLDLDEKDARVYYLMGEISKQKGGAMASNKMMGFYEKAIALDPVYPEPYRAIGLLHYKDEKWGLAKKAFESYLSLSPHIHDKEYIMAYIQKCQSEGV
jgi:tetratricopeptide (TPR) repeat protein